jgi:hypothetical protein
MTVNSIVPVAVSSQLDNTGEERIHLANTVEVTRTPWVAPVPRLYVAVDTETSLRWSVDGASFPNTVATGLSSPGTEPCVMSAGGRLYHLGSGTSNRTSTNASTFAAVAGLPASGAGVGTMIKLGSEWQWYGGSMYVSADGINFTQRTITSGVVNLVSRPAIIGNTVVCKATGNRINVSVDGGSTFTEQQLTAFNSFEGFQRTLAVDEFRFILFGRAAATSNLLIGRSTTGGSGTWTTAAGPATATCHGVAFDPDAYRIVMVLQTGATYYSDDEGATWSPGAAVPYGGALALPPEQTNNMIFSEGYFYFCAAQGSGVNHVYRSPDGVTAWSLVFTGPSTLGINSMCEFAS